MERHSKSGRRFLALIILPLLSGPLLGQPAVRSWSDAISPLVEQRTIVEDCVALLKKYGEPVQIDLGRIAYSKAKAESDAVIAGLLATLATGGSPANWPLLQERLNSSNSGLKEFCQSVTDMMPPPRPGEKSVFTNIAIAVLEPLLKAVSDAVSAIYNDYRNSSVIARKSIQTMLEAAKWPDFGKVDRAE